MSGGLIQADAGQRAKGWTRTLCVGPRLLAPMARVPPTAACRARPSCRGWFSLLGPKSVTAQRVQSF